MDLGLQGKTAIVTGSGRGIGKVIARTFAEEGAIPVIAELNEATGKEAADELKSFGFKALFVQTDISDIESSRQLAKKTVEEFGKIDILVNNATIIAPAKFFMDETMEEYEKEINVIYKGNLYSMKSVLEYMIKQNSGSIVNILSDAARIGEPRMVNYGAAKAGIGALSRGLAKEVARNKIRINCVSPSMTVTELGRQRREEEKEKLGEEKFNELQQRRLRLYPLGRLGEPQDIASAVVFLCSERAGWITGQTISVNGGYAIGPW